MTNVARRIPVKLKEHAYEIVIGGKGLNGIGEELLRAGITPRIKVLVTSNKDVAAPYGELCLQSLEKSGFDPSLLIIEAGEENKTLDTISLIHDEAQKNKLERGSLMIALGGGVVGDMTGFAAATWLRGVAYVQVPTTLLAMVDAAIGGKTGVNHAGGKNLIGAFHQPKLVLIDPTTLKTLPEREFQAGLAEVIKYGVIGDISLFNLLEGLSDKQKSSAIDRVMLEEIIERAVTAKAEIVAADEQEKGVRAILNYGHTFGHVIETLCGYGTWLHGEAVAIGMVAVGALAVQLKSWSIEDANRQRALIEKMGLPTLWPNIDQDSVMQTLKGDKKVVDGNIRFVIPTKIGAVDIRSDITKEEIETCLSQLKVSDLLRRDI